jgi:hypothetical protein
MAKLDHKDPENVVGEIIKSGDSRYTVIGITKDYVYNNIYGSVAPVIMFNDSKGNNTNIVNLRFKRE